MFNTRIDMMRQLMAMFEGIDADAIAKTPVFLARIHIRDRLLDSGLFGMDHANELVAILDIELDDDLFDDNEEMTVAFELLDRFADMIVEAFKAMTTQIDSWPLFIKMMEGANLHIKS